MVWPYGQAIYRRKDVECAVRTEFKMAVMPAISCSPVDAMTGWVDLRRTAKMLWRERKWKEEVCVRKF